MDRTGLHDLRPLQSAPVFESAQSPHTTPSPFPHQVLPSPHRGPVPNRPPDALDCLDMDAEPAVGSGDVARPPSLLSTLWRSGDGEVRAGPLMGTTAVVAAPDNGAG